MSVIIQNDRKGKDQSFEANLRFDDTNSMSHGYANVWGFGQDEREARFELDRQIAITIARLEKLKIENMADFCRL